MKNEDNKFSALCPCSLTASWEGFSWGKYPGGVQVSFALTDGKRLLLVKPTRWNYAIVQLPLDRAGTLDGALSKMYAELRKVGVGVTGIGTPFVQQVLEKSGVFHVLVVVPYANVSGSGGSMECVDSALMLRGFMVSSPMAMYVPRLLCWADAHEMPEEQERLAA